MVDFAALKSANARRWEAAKLTRVVEANNIALHLFKAKARYQTVEAKTGVPWWFTACVHERESSQDWKTQLGQGDPLDRPSIHVPAGRGPFATWEDGAVDALINCRPYTARNKDWSIGGALAAFEAYNGMIYFEANRPSPYVFAGTTIYDPPTGPGGKVLVDHGPIVDVRNGKRVVDAQMGCAALLKALMALDPSIKFGAPSAILVPNEDPPQSQKPVETSWFQAASDFLSNTFRGRK